MVANSSHHLPFTQEQLKAKLLRDDLCAINALVQLLQRLTDLPEQAFLVSLRDQAIWHRRDHERGINLNRPLLSTRQLAYLRRILTETYLDVLYEIAAERLSVTVPSIADQPSPEAAVEWEDGEPVSQSWFCTICDGLAVIEHCGLRYCRDCYDEKRNTEVQADPYDLRHLHDEG